MMATAETTDSSTSSRTALRRRDRPNRLRRVLLWLLLPLLAAGGAWGAFQGATILRPPVQPIEARVVPIGVSALGRLSPQGEVIKVAPVSGADGGRVDRLLVDVGAWVKAGQVVAILDPYRRREAAVLQAQAQVGVAGAKLAQVKAGPKPEDVHAQEALISRSGAEVRAAERDLGRSSILLKRAAGSRQDLDDQALKYEQSRDSLDQAKAQLDAMKAIRPADVKVAEAELIHAEAGLALARAAGSINRLDFRLGERPIEGLYLVDYTVPGPREGSPKRRIGRANRPGQR